jgi:hypothetical protein
VSLLQTAGLKAIKGFSRSQPPDYATTFALAVELAYMNVVVYLKTFYTDLNGLRLLAEWH